MMTVGFNQLNHRRYSQKDSRMHSITAVLGEKYPLSRGVYFENDGAE